MTSRFIQMKKKTAFKRREKVSVKSLRWSIWVATAELPLNQGREGSGEIGSDRYGSVF
jgi:hypothetical protein